MREIGEQWIEVIDGKRHMYKAVKGVCENCGVSHLCTLSSDCPMAWGFIAKDLGILNEDGCLPSSFGEYPTLSYPSDKSEEFCLYAFLVAGTKVIKTERAWGKTEQEVKDNWNRRS